MTTSAKKVGAFLANPRSLSSELYLLSAMRSLRAGEAREFEARDTDFETGLSIGPRFAGKASSVYRHEAPPLEPPVGTCAHQFVFVASETAFEL